MPPDHTLYQVRGKNFTAGFEVEGQLVVRHAPILRKWCSRTLEPTLAALLRSGFSGRVVGLPDAP